MTRRHAPIVAVILLAWTAVAAHATTTDPRLLTVSATNFHLTATFQASGAKRVFLQVATDPATGTNGEFLPGNTVTRTLTSADIAAGSYLDTNQIAPGHYWAMLNAYTPCDETSATCVSGISNIVEFTIAPPVKSYRGLVEVAPYARVVTLGLRITPAGGGPTAYRVCWRNAHHFARCFGGTIVGGSWSTPGSDQVKVPLRDMRHRTRFSWYVGGRVVATRSASTIPA